MSSSQVGTGQLGWMARGQDLASALHLPMRKGRLHLKHKASDGQTKAVRLPIGPQDEPNANHLGLKSAQCNPEVHVEKVPYSAETCPAALKMESVQTATKMKFTFIAESPVVSSRWGIFCDSGSSLASLVDEN